MSRLWATRSTFAGEFWEPSIYSGSQVFPSEGEGVGILIYQLPSVLGGRLLERGWG